MVESEVLRAKVYLVKVTLVNVHCISIECISSECTLKSKEMFVIDSVLKTNPRMHKIKYLNGKTITEIFYEKELLLSKL